MTPRARGRGPCRPGRFGAVFRFRADLTEAPATDPPGQFHPRTAPAGGGRDSVPRRRPYALRAALVRSERPSEAAREASTPGRATRRHRGPARGGGRRGRTRGTRIPDGRYSAAAPNSGHPSLRRLERTCPRRPVSSSRVPFSPQGRGPSSADESYTRLHGRPTGDGDSHGGDSVGDHHSRRRRVEAASVNPPRRRDEADFPRPRGRGTRERSWPTGAARRRSRSRRRPAPGRRAMCPRARRRAVLGGDRRLPLRRTGTAEVTPRPGTRLRIRSRRRRPR